MPSGLGSLLEVMGVDFKEIESTLKTVGQKIPEQLAIYDARLCAIESKLASIDGMLNAMDEKLIAAFDAAAGNLITK